MTYKFPPVSSKAPHMLHGADYNPEQWLRYPEVLEEDIRLMKLAKCNVMSIGIFSWVSLEPEEGIYTFEWLDQVLDRFAANGIYAFLATPSGATCLDVREVPGSAPCIREACPQSAWFPSQPLLYFPGIP